MFSFDDVDVLGIRRNELRDGDAAAETWPCPACGERAPFRDALEVHVRNRIGDPMDRRVLVCRSCLVEARRETWLDDLGDLDLEPPKA